MNRIGSVAYGAAIIALIFCAQNMSYSALFLHDNSTPAMFALGVAGLAIATFGLPILSICIWGLVKRVRARWALHLLFILCAIAILLGGYGLFHYSFGSPLNITLEVRFMLPALLFLCLTGMVHAVALIVELAGMFRRRADVR